MQQFLSRDRGDHKVMMQRTPTKADALHDAYGISVAEISVVLISGV
jgi:hypothetical protein